MPHVDILQQLHSNTQIVLLSSHDLIYDLITYYR